MSGLAFSFTPTTTKIAVNISAMLNSNTVGGAAWISPRYGTGVAPVNGATDIGTSCTNDMASPTAITQTTSLYFVAATSCAYQGMTPGVTYWFDLAMRNSIAGGVSTAFLPYFVFSDQ